MTNATLSQLLKGSNGTGIGRAEAAEIVRRYARAIGCPGPVQAQKWGGTWFFVSAHGRIPLSAAVDDLFDFGGQR